MNCWIIGALALFFTSYAARGYAEWWVPALLGVVSLILGIITSATRVDPRVTQSQAWQETKGQNGIVWLVLLFAIVLAVLIVDPKDILNWLVTLLER